MWLISVISKVSTTLPPVNILIPSKLVVIGVSTVTILAVYFNVPIPLEVMSHVLTRFRACRLLVPPMPLIVPSNAPSAVKEKLSIADPPVKVSKSTNLIFIGVGVPKVTTPSLRPSDESTMPITQSF